MNRCLLLTCEHAGHRVPAPYRSIFRDAQAALVSHRGWDPGARTLGNVFQQRLGAPFLYSDVTRLLVELNRSLGHRNLFSEFTASLDAATKTEILDLYYHPHRQRVESWIDTQCNAENTVIHLSLHTFTPQLDGKRRSADVGLLYDPGHGQEKAFCDRWHAALKEIRFDLRIRRNYPYLGKADGMTTTLRRRFGKDYFGIELEVNQSWITDTSRWQQLCSDLADSFATTLGTWRVS